MGELEKQNIISQEPRSILLLFYGRSQLHKIWVLFNLSVAVWGYSAYFIGEAKSQQESLIYWRIAFEGVNNICESKIRK